MIKNGSVVSLEYTVSDDNGNVIQSNKGKSPLTYTHGQQEIIPGLEQSLSGMNVNQAKNIKLQPEEAYGQVNPEAFAEVPKEKLPGSALEVGAVLSARGSQGEDLSVRVHEVRKETVVLDLNHPLAGKTLTFDVKVLDIESGETK
jgi:FKBP-type peptidyl-prolyl cis-trans isomerase SlyD